MLSIYLVTMRSGEVRTIVARNADIARKRASEDATEEGLRMLDNGDGNGRLLITDAPHSVRLYRKAGG